MINSVAESNPIFCFLRGLLFIGICVSIAGCSTLSVDERDAVLGMADTTVETLCEDHPTLRAEIDSSSGYLVIDKRVVKIPVFGGGSGRGVIIDSRSNETTFIKASRMEFGGGWGARSYKMLMVFSDPKRVDKIRRGTWIYELGAEATAGTISVEGTTDDVNPKKGYNVYTLTDGGASATYTLRAIRLKPCRD